MTCLLRCLVTLTCAERICQTADSNFGGERRRDGGQGDGGRGPRGAPQPPLRTICGSFPRHRLAATYRVVRRSSSSAVSVLQVGVGLPCAYYSIITLIISSSITIVSIITRRMSRGLSTRARRTRPR